MFTYIYQTHNFITTNFITKIINISFSKFAKKLNHLIKVFLQFKFPFMYCLKLIIIIFFINHTNYFCYHYYYIYYYYFHTKYYFKQIIIFIYYNINKNFKFLYIYFKITSYLIPKKSSFYKDFNKNLLFILFNLQV